MYSDDARKLLLSQQCAVEESIGKDSSEFKVGDEVFATLSGTDDEPRMTLKCDPELALALREGHNAIRPGIDRDKKHWNTLYLEGGLSDAVVADLVGQSWRSISDEFSPEKRAEIGIVEPEEDN